MDGIARVMREMEELEGDRRKGETLFHQICLRLYLLIIFFH